eukprot:CAMPEP_0172311922 /NCGR_PEP_ID=MMETSP1058-20130122/16073_1 /TAXON_ID=83371 /ORGANISM="Detonula confervacea, Strain CCMP 353" /LENGTH=355 /DNA_ID=CAMNT_0013025235 /DNA_START=7 /DNA_END=1074 /DNA_ORIENTATION=+
MGGDDLGDDEYLFETGFIDTTEGRGTAISSDDENGSISDDNDDGTMSRKSSLATSSNKRKGVAGAESSAAEDGENDASSSKKKRKKNVVPTSSKNILIHAGRGIAMDSAEAQAMFMGTLYSHSIKLSEGAPGGEKEEEGKEDEGKEDGGDSEAFSFQPHMYSPSVEANEETKKFQHNNLAAFLKSGPLPSNKRLKNWKHPNSPMVLVVTLSARRSVELMKQFSTLKLPIAKLFAKHMSVEDQVGLLKGLGKSGNGGGAGMGKKGSVRDKCYSLAVGTPGRLLKLLRHGRDEEGSGGLGALRLNHTEVVIIDCHEDSKGWNVCTLKDTSKELMEFMKEGMIPQLDKRKGKIKLAMF